MVRAILAGNKTQTRRIVKPQPEVADRLGVPAELPDVFKIRRSPIFSDALSNDSFCKEFAPYGVPRERLWVREAWRLSTATSETLIQYRADGAFADFHDLIEDNNIDLGDEALDKVFNHANEWRPSIFMSRWASRLTLGITDVRVERLQDISESDVQAEGFPYHPMQLEGAKRRWYRALWESLNGPGSWDVNPWVWVISFSRVNSDSAL